MESYKKISVVLYYMNKSPKETFNALVFLFEYSYSSGWNPVWTEVSAHDVWLGHFAGRCNCTCL